MQTLKQSVTPMYLIFKGFDPLSCKLDVINAAQNLNDLKSPPGNRLEPLKGDFKGFYSIRINSQWRIVFRWESNAAHDVQITDYH